MLEVGESGSFLLSSGDIEVFHKQAVCYLPAVQENAVSHINCIRCFQLNWSGKVMLINQEVNETEGKLVWGHSGNPGIHRYHTKNPLFVTVSDSELILLYSPLMFYLFIMRM